MNWKTLGATTALAATLGIGVLAGSLLSPSANASVPTTQSVAAVQAQAQTTPTAVPDTQKPAPPADGQQPQGPGPRGGRGGFGGMGGPMGPGGERGEGHGGPGFDGGFGGPGGRFGGGYTADGATRAISSTTSVLTTVKADLAFVTGKMDTATVQAWVNNADNLLKAAQTANSSGQYGKAVETAQAASALAETAEMVIRQSVAADTLPSYTQRQQGGRPDRGMMPGIMPGVGAQGTMTVTQAQASRVLANLYNNIVSQEAVANASASKGDASTYLAAAKDQYSKAYTAYQAGNYSDAVKAANVGQSLLRVVDLLIGAGSAPNGPDVPVQVPAPFV